MKKLVLIDSNAIIHRAYHSIPKSFSNRKGEQTNAVYGFTTTLIRVLEDLNPDYIIASFDVGKVTFRTDQYAQYKAHRVAADQELYDQIPRVKQLLSTLNIPICEKEGYEADDCIGTIVSRIKEESKPQGAVQDDKELRQSGDIATFIVTGDKDLFQLLNGEIFVYWLKKGLSESAIVDSQKIKDDFNLDPEDFIDLKALAGDSSDNIPGVPGIGPKTATTLLQKYDTLANIYAQLETPQLVEAFDASARIKQLLIDNKDQAFLSRSLATIHKEVPIEFDLEDAKWGSYDKAKLREFFEEMGFHSLLKRFGAEPREETKTKQAEEQKKKDEQLKLL